MGIDVNQWRSKIGCFHLKPKTKNKATNASFYLNESAYVCLHKSLLLSKLFLCISILLVMSGDVEVNPGPTPNDYKSNFPVQGSFHQGHESFSIDSRGRQCLPCCVLFIIYSKIKPQKHFEWKCDDLNEVLCGGDFVYRFSREFLRPSKIYLEPRDCPHL